MCGIKQEGNHERERHFKQRKGGKERKGIYVTRNLECFKRKKSSKGGEGEEQEEGDE